MSKEEYPTISTNIMCCVHPPGDGSTCAGGSCCCTGDYTCDKCRMKNVEACTAIGDENGNKLYNPNCGCSDCVAYFEKKDRDEKMSQ